MFKSYRVLRPIGWYGRYEVGATVKMESEEALNFGKEYLEELSEVAVNDKSVQISTDVVKKSKKINKSEGIK